MDLKIFTIVATVPTGLQTDAKVLQIQILGGGGTPWLQPKSNIALKLAPLDVLITMAVDFGFKYFQYSSNCAHMLANLCNSAANAPFRGWKDTLNATQK